MSKVNVIIAAERKKIVRSKSLLIFGILFILLLLAITMIQLFALPAVSAFTRYSATFLNALLFLLPLFTLAIGALSLASDIDSRWFTLLRTYPFPIRTYIWGKYIALVTSFSIFLLIGYSLVLLLHALLGKAAFDFLLIFLALFSVAIFSSLAIFVGSISKNRMYSLSLSLSVWTFFLLIYDFIVMAIGTFISGELLKQIVIFLTFTNPVEWLRIGYILYSGNASVLGPAYYSFSQFFLSFTGIMTYVFVAILWIVSPLVLSNFILLSKEGS